MCDQTGNNRRTINRELDLESGQWEEAIRREERERAVSIYGTLILQGFPVSVAELSVALNHEN